MATQKRVMTDTEMDILTQMELSKLKRQFRYMQDDQGACPGEVRKILLKQGEMIEQLEMTKAALKVKLQSSDNKLFKLKEAERLQQIKQLLLEHDEIEKEIKHETQQLTELQGTIEDVHKETAALKNQHHLKDSNLEDIIKQETTDRNLQERLHVETTRFNTLICENHELREEIDHLLLERGKFKSEFGELTGKLYSGKKLLMDLIEQSTLAYDKREEALVKLEALKTRAKQDLLQHSEEMQGLVRNLDEDTEVHDFVAVKGQRRLLTNTNPKNVARKEKTRRTDEEEQRYLGNIILQVQEVFGEDDVEQLAYSFLKLEQDNFNLFSFINELNKEMTHLREHVGALVAKTAQEEETILSRDKKQQEIISQLKETLNMGTEEVQVLEKNLTKSNNIVSGLLDGIHIVFRFLQCDPTRINRLLGRNTVVTNYNYMIYLNKLELRVTHIVDLVWYLTNSKGADKVAAVQEGKASVLLGNILNEKTAPLLRARRTHRTNPNQPCPLCIEKEEISEVDETIAAPLAKQDMADHMKPLLSTWEYVQKLHNVSTCKLPKSRRIIQRRFHN